MLRLQAVRSLLLEEIADLRPSQLEDYSVALRRARLRAALIAAVDGIAILVLFALRPGGGAFLVLDRSEQGLFTLGVLAVATHAGYRLAQRQKLAAVERALETLPAGGESDS